MAYQVHKKRNIGFLGKITVDAIGEHNKIKILR